MTKIKRKFTAEDRLAILQEGDRNGRTEMQNPVKLTTPNRFKVTISDRRKLTTSDRLKLTT